LKLQKGGIFPLFCIKTISQYSDNVNTPLTNSLLGTKMNNWKRIPLGKISVIRAGGEPVFPNRFFTARLFFLFRQIGSLSQQAAVYFSARLCYHNNQLILIFNETL